MASVGLEWVSWRTFPCLQERGIGGCTLVPTEAEKLWYWVKRSSGSARGTRVLSAWRTGFLPTLDSGRWNGWVQR